MRRLLPIALCLFLTACPSDIVSALREYGYMPVRPASSLWQPGAFVVVESRKPLQVSIICTAKQMMGPDFKPLESITTNAELARASKRGITMAAHVDDIISADTDLQSIKSVKMTLKNVRIFTVSDYQVAVGAQIADKRCLRAIEQRRRQGFDVTFISAAIQADVSYSVAFHKSAKLDVDAKVAAVQNLSAKLGVDATSSNEKGLSATGLIWGLKDDQYLAYVFQPAAMPKVERGSRIMDPEQIEQLEVMMREGSVSPALPPVSADLPLITTPSLAQDPAQRIDAATDAEPDAATDAEPDADKDFELLVDEDGNVFQPSGGGDSRSGDIGALP